MCVILLRNGLSSCRTVNHKMLARGVRASLLHRGRYRRAQTTKVPKDAPKEASKKEQGGWERNVEGNVAKDGDAAVEDSGFPWKRCFQLGAVLAAVPVTAAFQYRHKPAFREAIDAYDHVRNGRMDATAAADASGPVLGTLAPALVLLIDACRALDLDLEPQPMGLGELPTRVRARHVREGGPDAMMPATATLRNGAVVAVLVPASATMAALQVAVDEAAPQHGGAGGGGRIVDVVFAEEGEAPAAPVPDVRAPFRAGGGFGGGTAGVVAGDAPAAPVRRKKAGPTSAQLRGKLRQLRQREKAFHAEMYSDTGRAIDDIEEDLKRVALQKDMCKRKLRETAGFLGLF